MRRNERYSKDSRESRTDTDTDTDTYTDTDTDTYTDTYTDGNGKIICRYTLSKHIIILKREKQRRKIQNLRKVVTQR